MQDIPRQKLVEIIARFGPQLCEDPKRCEGLLRDYCGDHKREITILVAAIREGVTVELRGSQGTIPHDVLLERCAQRLRSNVGVVPHLARWSVETWALALGVLAPSELTNLFRCPSCGTSGNSATPIAGKSIKCPKCKSRVRVSDDGRQFALETKSIADSASTTTVVKAPQPHDTLSDPFAQPPNDPLEQLRSALRQIMADGVITDAEKSQIQQLRESLGVSQDDAQRLFAQIKAEVAEQTPSASIPGKPVAPIVVAELVEQRQNTRVSIATQSNMPKPWVVTANDFAEETLRFWASGRANGFAPDFQRIATTQLRDSFLSDVLGIAAFIEANGLPFFKGEAWISGGLGQTMRLTSYRMILTAPTGGLLVIPLPELRTYAFAGAAGTLKGIIFGSNIEITTSRQQIKWSGQQLANLHFPFTEFVHGVQRLLAWQNLPAQVIAQLSLNNLQMEANEFATVPVATRVVAEPESSNAVVTVDWEGTFLIIDCNVQVMLDGKPIGTGSLVKGARLQFSATAGNHVLSVKIPIRRAKTYQMVFERGAHYAVKVTYDTTWGNFSSECAVQRQLLSIAD